MLAPMRGPSLFPWGEDPDDDDDFDDDAPEGPTTAKKITIAVVIAGLSAFAVKLAEWGVEKIRERVDPSTKEHDE